MNDDLESLTNEQLAELLTNLRAPFFRNGDGTGKNPLITHAGRGRFAIDGRTRSFGDHKRWMRNGIIQQIRECRVELPERLDELAAEESALRAPVSVRDASREDANAFAELLDSMRTASLPRHVRMQVFAFRGAPCA